MYVSVRVIANSKEESVEELKEGRLRVRVKEPAKQNLANHRVLTLVAKHFKLPSAKVRLISGHHTPSKLFSLDIER